MYTTRKQEWNIFLQSQITKTSQKYLDNFNKDEDPRTELKAIPKKLHGVLKYSGLIETEGEENADIEAENSQVTVMKTPNTWSPR
ncbi:uncharacterized protein N7483_007203 [Penicillium malachiteum]|uniref:uncharacterized protein n=1 Tax=Penicillium malachiteum TaxID=1324776 RepID=UPI0025498D13|nr:uncharacterized protein N7483_007203 [Penicillium malachiteum]KAJ5725846.1 hypothetical protein N7483_007203 [Penicillium malachiteum]